MKRLWLIILFISFVWGQTYTCQYDGNKLTKTFQSKFEGGKTAYLWKCSPIGEHSYWIVENPATSNQSWSGLTEAAIESLPELGDITRSETTIPFSLGGFAYVTAIPFIDIEAEINASFSSYDYSYSGGTLENDCCPKLEPIKIPMITYGGSVSIQKKFFKFPTIRLLVGVGMSKRGYSKIITTEVLLDAEFDDSKLDVSDTENLKYLKDFLA